MRPAWTPPYRHPAHGIGNRLSAPTSVSVRGTGRGPAVRREGTDPVVAERDFPGLEARLEDSTAGWARSGTYRTATISHRAGPSALGDSVLFLDWHGDGRGYRRHEYTGSPTV